MVLRLWKESRGSECLIKILVCSLPKNLENSFYRQQHFPSDPCFCYLCTVSFKLQILKIQLEQNLHAPLWTDCFCNSWI